MKRIYLEIIYSEQHPEKSGVYSVRFWDNKQKQHINRRIFYDASSKEFRMKNGHKNAKIDRWYKPVNINNALFNTLNS